jgi:protein-disulfide isomerase
MGTFVLVLAYAFCAVSLLPLKLPAFTFKTFLHVSLLSLALVALPGVLLQPFGKKTTSPAATVGTSAAAGQSLEHFLAALSPKERADIEGARKTFLAARSRPVTAPTSGRVPQQAPVVLQDFTDIKCSHCLTAEMVLTQLLNAMPKGSVAVEPRYYPLDAECNPSMRRPGEAPPPGPPGARCAAALAQICLEGSPGFAKLRGELFHAAGRLHSREDVLSFLKGKAPTARLEACMDSPDALARLHADIALADSYGIRGTPFFLLNGKTVGFSPSFWTAMVLAGGDAQHPAFEALK